MEMNCGGSFLNLQTPKVMGILNLTQDSFYDGGRYHKGEEYLIHAQNMIEWGAHIIDVGVASTRPGATVIDPKDEWQILQEPLTKLRKRFPDILLSVDTYNAAQVEKCAHLGVNIINDISGGSWDENMFKEISRQNMAYVMMHIQGNPSNMQHKPQYTEVINELITYFRKKIKIFKDLDFTQIIIDPGFGFGKTVEHNYEILANLHSFKSLECPILAGLSRKSMIFKMLDVSPKEALNGTAVLNTLALQQGANILRVHDVKQANETIKLLSKYKEYI
ncbi:MAG: dihydropteroate synthase [Bacteroidetes bacterium 4572_77]|nr:MAG: dihydropteroate synthase [Bacteroidetes bacterium 4572_77]